MEIAAALVALAPVLGLMWLLAMRLRQLPPRQGRAEPRAGPGGDAAGTREPRRPLVPAGAAAMSLDEPPGDESGRGDADVAMPGRRLTISGSSGRQLRAS